ncbi:hypothetical protein MTP99_002612 [Tenebrio molitor]|nr:hypothetical protein MTP99_002612 [Tenebrio molitor]
MCGRYAIEGASGLGWSGGAKGKVLTALPKENTTRLSGYTDSGKIDLITFPEMCHGARVKPSIQQVLPSVRFLGLPWGANFMRAARSCSTLGG